MVRFLVTLRWLVVLVFAALAACGGPASPTTPGAATLSASGKGPITINPQQMSLLAGTKAYTFITEYGYDGVFTGESSGKHSCTGIATWNSGLRQDWTVTMVINAASVGSCVITFSDTSNNRVRLWVQVLAAPRYSTLYRFQGGNDGALPYYGYLSYANGVLYGTTFAGGSGTCPPTLGYYEQGCGTVFSVDPSTGAERVVYSFQGGTGDGARPWDNGLVAVNGVLYGTTWLGGTNSNCYYGNGCGTVFSLDPATGDERIVHNFGAGTDGSGPHAGLIEVGHALYGTTGSGGTTGNGTVYQLRPNSSGYTERVLYNMQGGTDATGPGSTLLYANGLLYGTTYVGGTGTCQVHEGFKSGCGTIFAVDRSSGEEHVVLSFRSNRTGIYPSARLTDVNGELFSTTAFGGNDECAYSSWPPGCGLVFGVNPSTGVERVIYRFRQTGGAFPTASLADVRGVLYGTAQNGGEKAPYCGHCGTIYELTPTASGYKESSVYFFPGGNDGSLPQGDLINVKGTLYGTTLYGGGSEACGGGGSLIIGCGTVFKLKPGG